VAGGMERDARGDGEHGRLLDSGMEGAGRAIQAGAGECPTSEEGTRAQG